MKRIGDRPILAMLDIRQLARDHGMTLGSREQGAGKVELRMAHECGPAWRDCRSISRGWPRGVATEVEARSELRECERQFRHAGPQSGGGNRGLPCT